MNLLELPVLFYIVCVLDYVTGPSVSGTTLILAGVGLRIVYSTVHLTYNNVMHRLTIFAASNFVLATLWILFFTHLERY